MLIVRWTPIIETEEIPPLGSALAAHLTEKKGAVLHASCSAWNLLWQILRENDLPMDEVAFAARGKPYFLRGGLFFSLSHSRDLCAAAVSDLPVGVDIERCRDSYRAHMIERSLHPSERDVFDGDFTRLWCRKEAAAKMTGEGIVGFPSGIDTTRYSYTEQKIPFQGETYCLAAVTGKIE